SHASDVRRMPAPERFLMLTADDIMLVRASFARVAPVKDAAADLFYARLFERAPELRKLFPADMSRQKEKHMGTLDMEIGALHDLDALVPKIKALGMRHAGYGAAAEHYDVVGDVLLLTLARALGDAFTPDVRAAWTKVYGVLAATMQAGAAE